MSLVYNLINSYYSIEKDFNYFKLAKGKYSTRVKRKNDGSSNVLDERRERIINIL
jgi:hypothetical protein